jgi:hypothetical protein
VDRGDLPVANLAIDPAEIALEQETAR